MEENISIKLALESSSFSQQMTAINKEVRNLDRDLKSAGKGIEGYEKSFQGIDKTISTTSSKIQLVTQKLQSQEQEFNRLTGVIDKQKSKLNELGESFGKNSKEYEKQSQLVAKNSEKLNKLSTDINATKGSLSQLGASLNKSMQDFENLGKSTKTLEEKLSGIDRQAQLTESEFNRLGSELSKNGQFFNRLGLEVSQMGSKIDSNLAKMTAYEQEIEKLSSELNQNKDVHARLASEIQRTETELSQAESAYGQNSSEALQLKASLLQLKDSFRNVDSDIERGSSELQRYQTELNQTETEVNELARTMSTMRLDRIGSQLTSSGEKLKSVGQGFNQYVTAPLLASGVGIGKLAYDFDKGLSKIGTLTNKSGQEMQAYGDRIKAISNSTGTNIKDVNETIYESLSSGAKNMDEALKLASTSSKLATAGFTESKTAVDGLTTVMNSYGLAFSKSNEIADKFIVTQNKGKLTVDELAGSIGQVAPTAKSAGVSIDELLSAIASTTANGISASESMTAIKASLSNVIKPSAEAQKMAKSLGLEFNATALQSKGLSGFLEDVKNKTGGSQEKMAKLFGSTEALNAIMVLTSDAGGKLFKETLNEMGNSAGATDKAFKNMQESAGTKLLNSVNELKNSMIELGGALSPVISWLADAVKGFAGFFNSLDGGGKTAVLAMAGLAMSIGPVLSSVGTLMTIGGSLSGLMGTLGLSVGAVTSVLSGGFMLALAGIVEKIGNSNDAIGLLQDKFGAFGTAVGGILEVLAGGVELTFGTLLIMLEGIGKGMLAVMKGDFSQIPNIVKETNAKLSVHSAEVMNNLTMTTTRAMSILKKSTKEQMSGVKDSFDLATKELPNITDKNIGSVADKFTNQFKKLDANSITVLRGTSETMNQLMAGITKNMSKKDMSERFKANMKDMIASGELVKGQLPEDIDEAMKLCEQSVANSGNSIKQTGTDVFNALKDGAKNGVEGMGNGVASMLNGMNTETFNKLTTFGATWKQAFEGVKTDGSMSTAQIKDTVVKNMQSMGMSTDEILNKLRSESASASEAIKTSFESLPKEVQTKMNIDAKNPEAVSKFNNDLQKLPKEVRTALETDNYKALDGVKSVDEAIKKIPVDKKVELITKLNKSGGDPDTIKKLIESLPKEKQTEIKAKIGDAIKGINEVENQKIIDKTQNIKGNNSDAKNKQKQTDSYKPKTPTQNIKGNNTDAKSKQNQVERYKPTTKTANINGNNANALNAIKQTNNTKVANKTFTITAIVNKVTNTINNVVNSVRNAFKAGGDEFKKSVDKIRSIKPLSIAPSDSPIPQQAQTGVTGSVVPMATDDSSNGESSTSPVPLGVNTGASNASEINIGQIMPAMDLNINLLSEMENYLKSINNELGIMDRKAKTAFGEDKLKYLNSQVSLLTKQRDLQHELAESMRKQQNELKYKLIQDGFSFYGDSTTNDYEVLARQERYVKVLESSVNADKENTNQALKNEYENAKKGLDDSKRNLQAYTDLTFDKIPKCSEQWLDLNENIKEMNVSIIKAKYELENIKINNSVEQFNDEIKTTQSQLSLLDKQIENVYGGDSQALINKKIELLQKEQDETHNLAESYRSQARIQQQILSSQGFIFNSNGQIVNRELINSFVGSGLFEYLNTQLNEYIDLTGDKIPALQVNWWNLQNEIKNTGKVLQDVISNNAQTPFNNSLTELSQYIDRVNDRLDILDGQYKNVYGKDKLQYYDKRIELMKEEIELINKQNSEYENLGFIQRNILKQYGVKFDASDLITNYSETLNKFLGKDNYEQVKSALDDYIKLTRNDLPDAWKRLLEAENNIKEAQKQKLEIIDKTEKEISNIYKKQVEDRKKLIDDETKAKVDSINEEKNAYNNARKEMDYNNNLQEQKDAISKLRESIDLAERDTSITGQKKLQELLDKLSDKNKSLQQMVQNKTDETVNSMLDKESNDLQKFADEQKKVLEDTFNENNIKQLVDKAIGSGMFTDIDGNISKLKDTMVDFFNGTGDSFGALSGIIKNDLISNLEIAMNNMKDISNIYKDLNIDFDSEKLYGNKGGIVNNNNQSITIQNNVPLVNIVGANTNNLKISDIQKMIDDGQNKIIQQIVSKI